MPVVSVTESQTVSVAGTLQDTYEITFTITGVDGSFTVTVPKDANAVSAAQAAIDETAAQVNSIKGISV